MKSTLDRNIINKVGLSDKNILLFYKGIMNNQILLIFTRFIENQTIVFPKLTRKINRVLIELTQNISYYSEEKSRFMDENRGVGILVLKELPDCFLLITGNKIFKKDSDDLLKKCNYINSLDISQLKELKVKQREKTGLYENRSNIGLIQAAIISSNHIIPEILYYNGEHEYFLLNVKFSKF